jgi:hypothetical protein
MFENIGKNQDLARWNPYSRQQRLILVCGHSQFGPKNENCRFFAEKDAEIIQNDFKFVFSGIENLLRCFWVNIGSLMPFSRILVKIYGGGGRIANVPNSQFPK